jgi:hypothetical protein
MLYSTSHCHLCEQAELMLATLAADFDLEWTTIEIAEDSNLLTLYELKIPVIKRVDNSHEISWPFTASQIIQLIS